MNRWVAFTANMLDFVFDYLVKAVYAVIPQ